MLFYFNSFFFLNSYFVSLIAINFLNLMLNSIYLVDFGRTHWFIWFIHNNCPQLFSIFYLYKNKFAAFNISGCFAILSHSRYSIFHWWSGGVDFFYCNRFPLAVHTYSASRTVDTGYFFFLIYLFRNFF